MSRLGNARGEWPYVCDKTCDRSRAWTPLREQASRIDGAAAASKRCVSEETWTSTVPVRRKKNEVAMITTQELNSTLPSVAGEHALPLSRLDRLLEPITALDDGLVALLGDVGS